MEKLIYRFSLDAHKNGVQKTLQGFETSDSYIRGIEVSLTENSESFDLGNNVTAMLYIEGQDIPRACEIEDGKITYTFQASDITAEGSYNCQLKVIATSVKGAEKVLVSPRFAIEAWESMTNDSIAEATDVFTALEIAVAKADATYKARMTSFAFDDDFVLTVKYGLTEDGYQVVYVTDIFTRAIASIQPTVEVGNTYESNEMKVVNTGTNTNMVLDFFLKRGERGFTGVKGDKGDKGDIGPIGRTSTINIGNVTEGSIPSVINVGTDTDAIFDITLPKGDKGDKGDKGADGTSFTIKGLFATYADLISAHPTGADGDAYAVGTSTSNVIYNWNVDTNSWDNIGSIQGPKGLDGESASIRVGSVTSGTTASVTNTGTTKDAVFNFVLPKGDKGDDGIDGKDGADGKDGSQVTIADLTSGQLIATVTIDGTPYQIKAPITIIENLDDIKDVEISNPLTGQVLAYENGKWKNKPNPGANGIEYDAEHSILYLKSGSTVLDFTTIDSGAASIIHVQTHEESWWGNPNVTIEIVDSEEDITGGHFDANGDYFHKIHFLGEYTIIVTDEDGEQYTETFEDTQIGQIYYVFVEKMIDGETVLPTDDIQTWLRCASIKSEYTTLTQILQDTSLLNSLLQNENANKYLVRSTTWAADCGADEAFCTYLGLCDDATVTRFINNETWLNAIANSQYLSKILPTHVPTMTSDTAPNGQAFSSGYAGSGLNWKAFDKNNTTNWTSNANAITSLTTVNIYIGYKFQSAIMAKIAKVEMGSQVTQMVYKIQGSNDNTTWIDVTDEMDTTEKTFSVALNTTENYLYYRLFIVKQALNASARPGWVFELDFLGR